MPFYEYSCKRCGKVVELLQKVGTKEAGVPCPECGDPDLVKKISVSAPAKVGSAGPTPCGAQQPSAACGSCCHCH
jgi:putative FmdB family regulatory protein